MSRIAVVVTGSAGVVMAGALVVPSHAAPPTVTPSPGYDARLQEQRSARMTSPPEIVVPVPGAHGRSKQGRHHHEADRAIH